MGSVRKASAWLGLVDDNDDERYYDDDGYSEGTEPGDAWVTDPRVKVASDVAEEKGRRIGTVTPDSFRDARAIGELFQKPRREKLNLAKFPNLRSDATSWMSLPDMPLAYMAPITAPALVPAM